MQKSEVGSIYAVVFKDGTAKVGQTIHTAIFRIKDHRRIGCKFGVHVWHEIEMKVPVKQLDISELIMMSFCAEVAARTADEWFKFPSAESAVSHLESFFSKLAAGERPSNLIIRNSFCAQRLDDGFQHSLIKHGKLQRMEEVCAAPAA